MSDEWRKLSEEWWMIKKKKNPNYKVEFNQPSCWLYFVPNLLVIQHLETLYLGGNHVRIVYERVWRKRSRVCTQQDLATRSRVWQVAKADTHVKYAEKLKSHASWSTTEQNFQSDQIVSSRLKLATQSNREIKSPNHSIWEKLTFRIPNTHQYKYLLYPHIVEIFQREF